MRTIDADALIEKCGGWYVDECTESGFIGTLENLLATEPTIQPVATDTNVGDKISRQVAIDRFNVIRPVDPKKDEYTKGIDVGIAMCIVAVKDQPSAQPEPQWIPCSERMPEDNTDVLLQFKSNMGVGFYEDGDWAINTGDGIYSMIGDNEEKPIAWMPLPEAYKPNKSKENEQ